MGQENRPEFKKLGVIGVGSMGGMMSLLYAEHGVEVHYCDPRMSEENVKQLQEHAESIHGSNRIERQKDYKELCENILSPDSPKLFVFSIPHGPVGNKTVEKGPRPRWYPLYWLRCKRRVPKRQTRSLYVPPGGDAETLKKIIPFLERVAAKDKERRPCTTCIGPGGSGHYVKMVHNGIKQGMMSAIAKVWFIMNRCLKMAYEAIADTFQSWNESDPLRDNFLAAIGADINRTKDQEGHFVLANVLDKVVQDVGNSEGTGVWTCDETVRLRVPSSTIFSAHLLRLDSADAAKRERVNRAFKGGATQLTTIKLEGLGIIKAMDREQDWNLDYRAILQIWQGGCIIQSDYISDLLDRVLSSRSDTQSPKGIAVDDLLSQDDVAAEWGTCFPSLKNVVLKSLAVDAYIPYLSATLEYITYSGSTELPTQFMEAELDYFGAHSFDLKSEWPGKPLKGSHHYEWKPPKGIFGEKLDGTK
ncbi:uncharacterized protein Z519_03778 [Cladophialophora bantiana CBS 173.52]|uniref:phosphogluconate dehydrogenase (NADP(+)-dependent, decarboxylating) n=1 Tax=Cladophialophora bantiana (strain ATCC 10958 / CBS 173.52 / CDC B-1940 / NIH 8579) TaxID=1442370 RepID=A0A0D2IEI0_CLAB1|nr:uncharacterized protein Z519_03778 [Cladophialophora bantiana CBS 173.52]KIW95194.1 hypothetical protein Z519_03778 [Cladophialophora bantiana CBS 173.52]